MYGDKVLNEQQVIGTLICLQFHLKIHISLKIPVLPVFCLPPAGERVRGWFPRRCVEKCHYDTAASENTSDKKVN